MTYDCPKSDVKLSSILRADSGEGGMRHTSTFVKKNTIHLRLALQTLKSVHHFHAPPLSKSPGSAPESIHPFMSLLCSQYVTYLPTFPTCLHTYHLCEHSYEHSSTCLERLHVHINQAPQDATPEPTSQKKLPIQAKMNKTS